MTSEQADHTHADQKLHGERERVGKEWERQRVSEPAIETVVIINNYGDVQVLRESTKFNQCFP